MKSYRDILDRNRRVIVAAPRNIILAPVFYAFVGFVFVAWGLSSPRGVKDFAFILGCGFVAFGALAYRQARKSLADK
ncbi:hypothetical protein [Dyella amyloliquefaciens]|uniref:hypothetical protein n=1 Tax=Dyella amyloliquefaciens TaxID=1770545 RepID=UPI00102EC4B7|nr:hypothetical protein [Dyella amyloliquefaciens]